MNEGNRFVKYVDEYSYFYHTYRTTETNSNFSEVSNNVVPGIFLNISRDRRLSFQIEFQYQNLSYPYIEFRNAIIPISINYDLLKLKKFTPYLNLGTFFNFNLKTNFKDLYLNYDDVVSMPFLFPPSVEDPQNYPKTYNYFEEMSQTVVEKNQQSIKLLFGAGMKVQITQKSLLKFELRYMNQDQKIYTTLVNAPGAESTTIFKSINSLISFQYTIL